MEFFVSRKGNDPTAESALHALRVVMRQPVREVRVGRLWRFEFSRPVTDVASCQRLIEKAAARAGRYLNVNRDHGHWFAEDSEAMPGWVEILVSPEPPGEPVAKRYFTQQGVPDLTQVFRGTLFRLGVTVDDAAAAEALAAEVMTTTSRHHGLLSNPHAQTAEVLRVWGKRLPVP